MDETAHADALWMGEAAAPQEAQTPTPQDDTEFTEADSWKLSDMAHHGRAPQEFADFSPQPKAPTAPPKEAAAPGQRLAVAEEELRTSLAALQAVLDSPGRNEQDLYRAVREQSRAILNAGQRIMVQTGNGFDDALRLPRRAGGKQLDICIVAQGREEARFIAERHC